MQLVWFIVLIGVLILVHELGHLAVARLCDVKVLRLSIGFGPRILTLRRSGTEYTLALIPLGGYLKLLGEEPGDEVRDEERGRAFLGKPLWQRVAIVIAGPAANLLFPAVIYFHFFAAQASAPSSIIGTVYDGQPAAGVLAPGDRIISIDDHAVRYWDDVNRLVSAAPGRELRITVERPGEEHPLTKVVTARAHERRDVLGDVTRVGQIGVAPHFQLAQIGVAGVLDGETGPSPAARAGLASFDVVTSVQGRPVESWADLEHALATNHGEALLVTYLRRQPSAPAFASIARLEPGSAQVFPSRIAGRYDTGIRPGELFLQSVEPGTPAATAGLHAGDALETIDGQPIGHWELLSQLFDERRERPFVLGWRTPTGERRSATLRLEPRQETDEWQTESTLYVFGGKPSHAARAVPSIRIDGRPLWAARRAVDTTASVTVTTLRVLAHLLVGRLPLSGVGGPIMIYHLAGVAAARGGDQFLAMLAMVSLNLGLLNLLPVPLLDGGHLLFFIVEGIRRRPLRRRTRERMALAGMAVLGALLLLALRNDVLRFWFKS